MRIPREALEQWYKVYTAGNGKEALEKLETNDAYYISVNSEYQFLPEFIEDKGIAILGDIGTVLKDLQKAKEESAFV